MHRWRGLAFLAPLLALFVFFVLMPLGRLVYDSFTSYDGLTPAKWIGLGNYKFLFHWSEFGRIVLNNVLIACGIFVWVLVPFVVSIVLFEQRRAQVTRAILFLPALLPPIVVGGTFRILLADNGPINSALDSVGLGALTVDWLADSHVVLVSVILVIAWATMGAGVLFFTAALSAISPSYIEAAVLDGARWRQLVWHIYRPALRPVTRFWALLLTVATVTSFFPWIYGLTRGGPGISSTTLDYAVYVQGIQNSQLGVGSALAVVGIIVIVVLLLVQLGARKVRTASQWRR